MERALRVRVPTITSTILFAVGVLLVVLLHEILLLTFAGIFFAVFLHRTAIALSHWTSWSRRTCLAVTIGTLLLASVAIGALLIPNLLEQTAELAQRLPQEVMKLRARLEKYPPLRDILRRSAGPEQQGNVAIVAARNVAEQLVGAGAALVYVAFIACYVAAEAQFYFDGLLRVFPLRRRAQARAILLRSSSNLYRWLLTRFLLMAVVGILTAVALWLVGVPMALTLGILSGILLFIPYIGAIVSFVPAFLVAVPQGTTAMLWVAVIYLGVHLLEGYVLYPLLQEKALSLPAALTLAFQAAAGALFGVLGLTLAPALLIFVLECFEELDPVERLDAAVKAPPGSSPSSEAA